MSAYKNFDDRVEKQYAQQEEDQLTLAGIPLKLHEAAREEGQAFINEYNGYIDEIAKKYASGNYKDYNQDRAKLKSISAKLKSELLNGKIGNSIAAKAKLDEAIKNTKGKDPLLVQTLHDAAYNPNGAIYKDMAAVARGEKQSIDILDVPETFDIGKAAIDIIKSKIPNIEVDFEKAPDNIKKAGFLQYVKKQTQKLNDEDKRAIKEAVLNDPRRLARENFYKSYGDEFDVVGYDQITRNPIYDKTPSAEKREKQDSDLIDSLFPNVTTKTEVNKPQPKYASGYGGAGRSGNGYDKNSIIGYVERPYIHGQDHPNFTPLKREKFSIPKNEIADWAQEARRDKDPDWVKEFKKLGSEQYKENGFSQSGKTTETESMKQATEEQIALAYYKFKYIKDYADKENARAINENNNTTGGKGNSASGSGERVDLAAILGF
ncbi:hypothetical protein FACS1894195_0100 [Bacteroidia bacterium]|nr:hypothetical protein FACS1894195_0100 [Bacteroidia bacterium]